MIGVEDNNSKFDNPYESVSGPSQPQAGSEAPRGGTELPPPFETVPSTASGSLQQLLNEDAHWNQDGGELPPEFTPYEAEHWISGDGDVVSHDPHLNEDGEALYRFLLSQAMKPPKFMVKCRGTHTETRTRTVTHTGHHHNNNNNGWTSNGTHTKTETYTETVVDFDFTIDITPNLMSSVNWTVADDEPAYRGKMVREADVQDGMSLSRRQSTRTERKDAENWRLFKEKSGYPPWVQGNNIGDIQRPPNNLVTRSSRTFREWADDYCASDKLLKEFVFEKVVYGWNIGALEKAIETLIRSTYYSGNLSVSFSVTGNKVYIRPSNHLSRALSRWWVKLLLWLTLIYPFIWMFKRFATIGGGIWRVTGAAYPLKEWIHLEDSVAGEDVAQYLTRREDSQLRTHQDRLLQTLPSSFTDRKVMPETAASSHHGAGNGDAWAESRPTSLAQFGGSTSADQGVSVRGSAMPIVPRLRKTPKGVSELMGLREGEWFKQWEKTLTRSVTLRLERSDPMTLPSEVVAENAGAMLDGFRD